MPASRNREKTHLSNAHLENGDPIVAVHNVCKEFHRDAITIPVLMGINLRLDDLAWLMTIRAVRRSPKQR